MSKPLLICSLRSARLVIPALAVCVLSAVPDRAASGQTEEGSASAEGVRIHYRIVGDGRPILLVNGGPGWSSDHMLPVAERLAEAYLVILFDQRGTGESTLAVLDSTTVTMDAMVEDIETLRRHLGIDSWIVMGHSFGGMLTIAYVAEHPEPVEAMVLSAPAGASLDFMGWYPASLNDRLLPDEREAVARWSDPERVAADPGKASHEIVRASIGAFLYDRGRLEEILAVLDEDTWSIETSQLVWSDLMRTDFDVRDSLRSFDAPVLVVQGRQDALGDLHAYRVSELFPNSSLEIIEESAHLMWVDQEERYFDIVLGFLEGVS